VAKWRNWQTHQTQNLAHFTVRVGSTPTFATTFPGSTHGLPIGLLLGTAAAQATVVVQGNAALLQGVRDSRIGPPMVSRALAIAHTCIYDAGSAHDDHARGAVLGDRLRRPATERIPANIEKAVGFAAYRCASNLLGGDSTTALDPVCL
jgi:hypothetical protein